MENQAKTCKECGRLLTLDHFRLTPLSADGHANICKDCAKQKRQQKRQQKKDEFALMPSGGVIPSWLNSRLGSLSRSCVVGAIPAN